MILKETNLRILYPENGMLLCDDERRTISEDWVSLAPADSPERFREITAAEAEILRAEWEAMEDAQ